MKPSFIECLESDYRRLFSAEEKAAVGIPAFERGDTSELRENRVLRLDDLVWQVRYLRLFMLVMEKRYGRVAFAGIEDRLRFYATAFNAGYASGEPALRRMMNERRFHTALLFPKTTYNYADVALFFFRSLSQNVRGERGHITKSILSDQPENMDNSAPFLAQFCPLLFRQSGNVSISES